MVAETRCDAVMIGRAAPANPWIFRQIAQYTATGLHERPTEMDRYRMIRTYFGMLVSETESEHPEVAGPAETDAAKKQKRDRESAHREAIGHEAVRELVHARHSRRGTLRKQIFEAKTGDAVLDVVEAFFEGRTARSDEEFADETPSLEALGKDCD